MLFSQDTIDAEHAREKLQEGARALDVRTREEYEDGHIKDSLHIDIHQPSFAEEIETLDKSKTYIVYCGGGGRASKALEIMKQRGFANAYNLKGGMRKWKEEGSPVEL